MSTIQEGSPSDFWLNAVRPRLDHLKSTIRYNPTSIPTTLNEIVAERATLADAMDALTRECEAEEAAMRRAFSVLESEYEKRVEGLRFTSRALGTQKNELSPVSNLPLEILAVVFAQLANLDVPKHRALGWITVTHVCRGWRDIALKHPSLWSRISLSTGPTWLDAMFSRARSSPLIFDTDVIDGGSPDHLPREIKRIAEYIPRTKLLRLRRFYISRLSAFSSPAPLLETLDLTTNTYSSALETFPPNLFGTHTPALRNLRLCSLNPFPWTSPLVKDLVSLEVFYNGSRHDGQPSTPLNDMLDSLSSLPALETLALHFKLSESDLTPHSTGSRQRRVVQLSKLTTLHLITTMTAAQAFFTHLIVPSNTTIRVDISDDTAMGDTGDVDGFFRALRLTLSLPHDKTAEPITVLSVGPTDAGKDPIVRERCFVRAWSSRASADQTPSISLDCDSEPRKLVIPALRSFASTHLRQLDIADEEFGIADWEDIAAELSTLRTVEVHGHAALTLCGALKLLDDEKTASEEGNNHMGIRIQDPPFMPALSSLTLVAADYGGLVSYPGTGTGAAYLCDAFPPWLAARAEAGYPLAELNVESCKMRRAWVEQLREAVPGMVIRWTEGP